jgi:hypothetical protein
VGHATLPPSGTFYFINMPPTPNIFGPSVCDTVAVVHSTIDAPPGVPGVSKNKIFLQTKQLSFCSKIELKLSNLWKTVKIEKTVFQRLCNFGSILAHQTSKFKFSGCWHIFWHSWDSWGRVNSGYISFLIFVFDFQFLSTIWRIFSFFSNWSQMSLLLIWHD